VDVLLTVLVAWADMYVSGSKMRSEEQVKRTDRTRPSSREYYALEEGEV
jgi:hypothetical protein